MQVGSIGKRKCANLFKLGDDMIQLGGVHALLAATWRTCAFLIYHLAWSQTSIDC